MTEEVRVSLPSDENGMVGRQCPNSKCGRYFKLKPGTGLPTDLCRCPYCATEGTSGDFLTQDQIEYAKSMLGKQVVDPMLRQFGNSLKRLNLRQQGPIRLEISVQHTPFRLHHYLERELETTVSCDGCGLEFAIYGVFATCPDCGRLNALLVCLASLETARKRVHLASDDRVDADMGKELLKDALGAAVAAFDAYGKAIRARTDVIRPKAKSNLFQDIEALDVELEASNLPSIVDMIGADQWGALMWFFQARHLYEHNAGVVDERFSKKLASFAHLQGRLLALEADRLLAGIDIIKDLPAHLDERLREVGS